ncbi:MAG: GAF domain-containing sensor histidine kinase, partial [Anaerolineales bacterium]|nr:GAF domain-containing sensor histidine kinase [Anaerolineales bacterium]
LAGAAAAAVRQIELFNDLEAVNRLSQKLNSRTFESVQEVIELVHESANELMDTNNMYVALYDDYTDTVRFGLVYHEGKRVENDIRFQPRQGGRGKTEWIIREREALFHPTRVESDAWYKQEGHIEYTGGELLRGSWVGVPMVTNERVLGVVITFNPTQDHVYSKDDLTSLQAMANQAAVAISNVRLGQQRKLREMGQLLSANIYLSEKELLEIIYQQANQLMHTDEMYIALYDRATDIVRFGLAFKGGERIDVETDPVWQPRRSGIGRTEAIIKTKEPLFHSTGEISKAWYEQEGHKEYVGLPDTSSWIGVPMIVGGEQVVGVISLWHREKDYAYDGHDLGLLQTLAATAASALDNARRFRESQALQELAALGTAMSAIQHRINNTLNIVSPNVTRLRKRVNEGDEDTWEILDIIDRNVTYTSQIIHRIQEALRGERQVVNINAILYEVAHQAEPQWQTETDGAVEVILELDDAIPQFEGPIGQISEIFTNLANNACRAMTNGGKLKINSKLDNGIIYVRVMDTGPGIVASILPRLFTRPVPTKETGGTSGLGLYLGSLIAQSLGGDIEVEDTGQNGTTMLVRVPVPRR